MAHPAKFQPRDYFSDSSEIAVGNDRTGGLAGRRAPGGFEAYGKQRTVSEQSAHRLGDGHMHGRALRDDAERHRGISALYHPEFEIRAWAGWPET